MSPSSLLSFALLLCISCAIADELDEWPFDLFEVFNRDRNGDCNQTDFLGDPTKHYAGYFKIEGTQDGHLSYMFFKNRRNISNAPLILWTNGGPGISSYYSLFMHNGPYRIEKAADGKLALCWNPYGWDQEYDVIFVEQPIGVGFSYSTAAADEVGDDKRAAEDVVSFLNAFFEEHSDMKDRDLYIAGVSYGGHYVPNIAAAIKTFNNNTMGQTIILKSVLLVSPWIDPREMFNSYPDYAVEKGLIEKLYSEFLLLFWSDCESKIDACQAAPSKQECQETVGACFDDMFVPILDLFPKTNIYDISMTDCENQRDCYDTSLLREFLNDDDVKRKMGVKPAIDWERVSTDVYLHLQWEMATDVSPIVQPLLNDDLKFTIIVGDRDFIGNYIGIERVLNQLEWKEKDKWKVADARLLTFDKGDGATVRSAGSLSFVVVKKAGHYVPMDQPELALELLKQFIDDGHTRLRQISCNHKSHRNTVFPNLQRFQVKSILRNKPSMATNSVERVFRCSNRGD